MVEKMDIQWRDIETVKPYERNAKKHPDDQVEHIANSLKRFGWKQPLVVDKDGVVVVGHGRLLAAKKLGLKTVPCVYADDLTEDEIKAFRLADNKTNESAWDDELLDLELDELAKLDDIDMSDFGFELSDGEDTLEASDDNYTGTVPDEPKAKVGDLYQLGEHRLMCGDATKKEDVEKLIDNAEIDLVLTDPPYGISVVKSNEVGGAVRSISTGGVFGKVGGGNIVQSTTYMEVRGDDTTDTARDNYSIIKDLSKDQILFGGNYFTDFLSPSRCWLVWDKQNTGNFADAELAWTSFDKGVKLYHFMWNGLAREGSKKVEGVHRVHPTQKPVGLLGKILEDYSDSKANILDCFGGSGSTLIACEQTGRVCYMMEYEPHYIDVIIDRWETFTGKKAVLLNAER